MKKLIEGIVKFRKEVLPEYKDTFARLALGQKPDALFIGCSDSRVAVNVFASTDPGDLFVVRNVGNLVPPFQATEQQSDDSVAAALEFSLSSLNVANIIVCGHSECGAMQALTRGRDQLPASKLRSWLQHGEAALKKLDQSSFAKLDMARHNQLSQLNVLQQLDHLRTYPIVAERIKAKTLKLHAWWFELSQADVYAFEESMNQFILIDEVEAQRILVKMG